MTMALSRSQQALRKWVLRTNAYWPFGQCSRAIYSGALKAFLLAFRGRKEISNIYLRNGMAESNWVPGLSDIDLTVLLRPDLTADKQFSFWVHFWKRYRSLRSRFPMLGEVEVLTENELNTYLTYCSHTSQKPTWTVLSGSADVNLNAATCSGWQRRALRTAICVYLDIFLPCFRHSDSPTYLHDLQRRARKILRLLQPVFTEAGHPAAWDVSRNPSALMAELLVALEAAVNCVAPRSGGMNAKPMQLQAPQSHDPQYSGAFANGVRSVIRLKKRIWALLNNDLYRDEIERATTECSNLYPRENDTAIVLPFLLFEYIVRGYYPYDYSNLQFHRTILFGTDPLAEIAPPERMHFVDHMMDHIPNVLKFTRSQELFDSLTENSFSSLHNTLDRALAVQLLLRDDGTWPSWQDVQAHCRAAFPGHFRTLENVKTAISAGQYESARQNAFYLFRSIADDVLGLLTENQRSQAISA